MFCETHLSEKVVMKKVLKLILKTCNKFDHSTVNASTYRSMDFGAVITEAIPAKKVVFILEDMMDQVSLFSVFLLPS